MEKVQGVQGEGFRGDFLGHGICRLSSSRTIGKPFTQKAASNAFAPELDSFLGFGLVSGHLILDIRG